MSNLSIKTHEMKLDDIYRKLIELKFKAHTEDVKLEIQKLNQKLSDIEDKEK